MLDNWQGISSAFCAALLDPDLERPAGLTGSPNGNVGKRYAVYRNNVTISLISAMEANFSLITISQSDVSKKFAGWAAIIAVPTMVAGFYGMNFKFMPELDWHYGYPVVVTFTITACFLLYYFFRRSGWL